MFVDKDNKNAFAVYIRVLKEPNAPVKKLKLKGLDKEKPYRLLESGEIFRGDELMYAGINIPKLTGDFESVTWRFEAIE